MRHNFFCKKIGSISNELLYLLQTDTVNVRYSTHVDFLPNVLNLSHGVQSTLLSKLLIELSIFFNPKGHMGTNYARMCPMSYLSEHTDVTSKDRNESVLLSMVKLQIPIITNDKAAMMWPPCTAVNFEIGGIYIIDNIKLHASINLSSEYRYYLTSRFSVNSVLDKELLD